MTRRWLLLTLVLAGCAEELDLGAPPEPLRPGTPELTAGFASPLRLRGLLEGGWCGSTVCVAASADSGVSRAIVMRYARPSGDPLDATPIELPPFEECRDVFQELAGASIGDDFFLAAYGVGALVSGADGSIRAFELPAGLCGGMAIAAEGDRWILAGYDADARRLRVSSMPRDGGAWTELASSEMPQRPYGLRAVDTGAGRFLVWSDFDCGVQLTPIEGGPARCVATGALEAAIGVGEVIAMAVYSSTDGVTRIGTLSPTTGHFEEAASSEAWDGRFASLGPEGYLELTDRAVLTRRHPDGRAVEPSVRVGFCDWWPLILPLQPDRLLVLHGCGVQQYLTYR